MAMTSSYGCGIHYEYPPGMCPCYTSSAGGIGSVTVSGGSSPYPYTMCHRHGTISTAGYTCASCVQESEQLKERKEIKPMGIIKKLKDLVLPEADRMLREAGLEDDNGNMTSEARELVRDELYKAHWQSRREAIAADIKKINEEKKGK